MFLNWYILLLFDTDYKFFSSFFSFKYIKYGEIISEITWLVKKKLELSSIDSGDAFLQQITNSLKTFVAIKTRKKSILLLRTSLKAKSSSAIELCS